MLQTFNDVAPNRLTTFGLGAQVPQLLELAAINDIAELAESYTFNDFRILGRGSNVVLPDKPLNFPLIRMSGELGIFGSVSETFFDELITGQTYLHPISAESTRIFAFAGAPLVTLSRETCLLGLSGLEFAAGIPGSIGGAVKMNAGAHGHELSEVLESVYLFSEKAGFHLRNKLELDIRYRHGGIPNDALVVGASFCLEAKSPDETKEKRRRCLDYRKRTQPLTMPSSGSVFRNPDKEINGEKVSAGWLIEHVGLKGHRCGGVAFSELHANWLVRIEDSAKAQDASELVEVAKQRVLSEYGVSLVEEIIFW